MCERGGEERAVKYEKVRKSEDCRIDTPHYPLLFALTGSSSDNGVDECSDHSDFELVRIH